MLVSRADVCSRQRKKNLGVSQVAVEPNKRTEGKALLSSSAPVVPPMSPGRTVENWRARRHSNPQPSASKGASLIHAKQPQAKRANKISTERRLLYARFGGFCT